MKCRCKNLCDFVYVSVFLDTNLTQMEINSMMIKRRK